MKEILKFLKGAYPDENEDKLKSVIDYAFMTFCFLSNQEEIKETDLRAIDLQWIKFACIEILNRSETQLGVISYSEIGYSVTFDSGDFSKGLKNMILPKMKNW